MNTVSCPKCQSISVVKVGFSQTKTGPNQRFLCRSCRKKFSGEWKRGKVPLEYRSQLILAYEYYGSLRNLQKAIYEIVGCGISEPALLKILSKYSGPKYRVALQRKAVERANSQKTSQKIMLVRRNLLNEQKIKNYEWNKYLANLTTCGIMSKPCAFKSPTAVPCAQCGMWEDGLTNGLCSVCIADCPIGYSEVSKELEKVMA